MKKLFIFGAGVLSGWLLSEYVINKKINDSAKELAKEQVLKVEESFKKEHNDDSTATLPEKQEQGFVPSPYERPLTDHSETIPEVIEIPDDAKLYISGVIDLLRETSFDQIMDELKEHDLDDSFLGIYTDEDYNDTIDKIQDILEHLTERKLCKSENDSDELNHVRSKITGVHADVTPYLFEYLVYFAHKASEEYGHPAFAIKLIKIFIENNLFDLPLDRVTERVKVIIDGPTAIYVGADDEGLDHETSMKLFGDHTLAQTNDLLEGLLYADNRNN